MNADLPPNTAHVDEETLNMLKEVMEDGFATLLETFIDDSKIRIVALRQAFGAGDAEEVRRAAHSLKGSSSNLGANQLVALCLHVENSGRDGNLDGLEEEIIKIEQEYQTVADIMKKMV